MSDDLKLNDLINHFSNYDTQYNLLKNEIKHIKSLTESNMDDKSKLRVYIFKGTIKNIPNVLVNIEELIENINPGEIINFCFLILEADKNQKGDVKIYKIILKLIFDYFEEKKKKTIEDDYTKILKNIMDKSKHISISMIAASIISKGIQYKEDAKTFIVTYLKKPEKKDKNCLEIIFESYKDKMNRRGIVTNVHMANAPITVSEYDYIVMECMKNHPQIAKNFKNDCLSKWIVIYDYIFHESIKKKIDSGNGLSKTDEWILKTFNICLSFMSLTEILDIIQRYIITGLWNQDNEFYRKMTSSSLQNIVNFILNMFENIDQINNIETFKDQNFKNKALNALKSLNHKSSRESVFYLTFILAICQCEEKKAEIKKIISEYNNHAKLFEIDIEKLKTFFKIEESEDFNGNMKHLNDEVKTLKEEIARLKEDFNGNMKHLNNNYASLSSKFENMEKTFNTKLEALQKQK